MTIIKKILVAGTMTLAIGATSITAFAASVYKTPAEAVAGITGQTVESVVAEKVETGKTLGEIADEAGKLDEFKAERLEMKKDKLAAQVSNGTITQEKADAILKAIEDNQANCDGTEAAKIGKNLGAKFNSNSEGQGTGGANRGTGLGKGHGGRGMGMQDGSCS